MAAARVRRAGAGLPLGLGLDRVLEHLGGRDPLVGHAADADHSLLEGEVDRVRLEHVGGQVEQLLAQGGRRGGGGVADVDPRAAAGGQQRPGHDPGVAGDHLDPFERPAQPVGEDLGRRGQVTLALRRRAEEEVGGAVGVHLHPSRLAGTEAARFDAGRHSDAQQPAVLGLRLLPAQILVADLAQRQLQQSRVVARVVDDRRATAWEAGVVRHLVGLDQVAPPELGWIEPEVGGEAVHHPLHHEVAQRPAASAHEAGRRGVRVDDLGLDLECGEDVGRHHVGHDDVGLVAAGGRVRPHVVAHLSPQSPERAVLTGGELELENGAVGVDGGLGVLAAGSGPRHRPAQPVAGDGDQHLL